MAWYDRLSSAVGRAARSIGRVFGGRPSPPTEPTPPSRPVTQGVYQPPYEPVAPPAPPPVLPPEPPPPMPEEGPMVPTDTGAWITEETPVSEYPGTEFNVYDPLNFDIIQSGYWDGDTFVADPVQPYMTQADWYRETLMPADYLRARYSWADRNQLRPNMEILLQLEADGYFVDWDQWREDYDAVMSAI